MPRDTDSAPLAVVQLPEPLIPAEVNMGGNDWFPLYFGRLRKSRWWRRASDVARARNVMLWGEAYSAETAGSLPDDDDELAEAAGYGLDAAAFRAVKAEIMEPWTLCSDGRWYHPMLCQVAMEAWSRKSATRKKEATRKAEQRARLKKQREAAAAPPTPAPPPVPRDTSRKGADFPQQTDKTEQTGQGALTGPGLPLELEGYIAPPKALFDEGWNAYPVKGRKRSGKEAARPFWMRAAKAVGGEAALVECIKRYAADPETMRDNWAYVPGFHRWLKLGSAVNYTPDREGETDGPGIGIAGRGDQRLDGLRRFDAVAREVVQGSGQRGRSGEADRT